MNKIIAIILLCAIMLLSLSGCAYIDKLWNCDKEETNEDVKYPIELSKDDPIVKVLLEELELWDAYIEYVHFNLADKINSIKKGTRALNVNYMGSDTYFVCAYYTEDYEADFYFDAPKFTWVKFGSEDEITQTYNDLTFVIAFQFNVASLVTDIVSTGADVPNLHHYQVYKPVFSEGVNTSEAIVFDEMFIHLSNSSKNDAYYTTKDYGYQFSSIPIVYTNYYDNKEYYTLISHYTLYKDGTRFELPLEYKFEEYYDELTTVMLTDQYCEIDSKGDTHFYILIKLEDIVKIIKETGGKNEN